MDNTYKWMSVINLNEMILLASGIESKLNIVTFAREGSSVHVGLVTMLQQPKES